MTILKKLIHVLRFIKWRWIDNFTHTSTWLLKPQPLSSKEKELVGLLKKNGIAQHFEMGEPALLKELKEVANQVLGETWDFERKQVKYAVQDNKISREDFERTENKDFLHILTPKKLSRDSIFVKYAFQPTFQNIANKYLGMNAQLRAIQLWLVYPSEGPPSSTQLWHKDADDFKNFKIFTYLSNVTARTGPFMYIPGSQPFGSNQIEPERSKFGRVSDEAMAAVVNRSNWFTCAGDAGAIVFADTSGFHKGAKAEDGYSLMLMMHYSSHSAPYGSAFQLIS